MKSKIQSFRAGSLPAGRQASSLRSLRMTIIMVVLVSAVFGAAFSALASSGKPQGLTTGFKGQEKMGIGLKNEWRAAMGRGDLSTSVSCLVGLGESTTPEIIKELQDAGFKVETILRTIVTGSTEIGNLPMLVAIDAVDSVDKGKKLTLKTK